MTKQLEALIASEIADFFAGVVEIHTELGGPNTVEEAQQQLTERVTRIASECEAELIAALEQSQQHNKELQTKLDATEAVALALRDDTRGAEKRIAELDASPLAVKLHKRSVGEVMHISGFSRDYAEGWCAGNDNAIHEIRAAGGTVDEGAL